VRVEKEQGRDGKDRRRGEREERGEEEVKMDWWATKARGNAETFIYDLMLNGSKWAKSISIFCEFSRRLTSAT
jgi:hypothetical protein